MQQSTTRPRMPLKNGLEQDVFSGWRNQLMIRPTTLKIAKKLYARKERRWLKSLLKEEI